MNIVSAQIRQYIHLISIHDKLAFMCSDIPRLEAFLAALPPHTAELNATKLRLAHKDFHWANVLYHKTSERIAAILDWEFSAVVPFQQWNPRRAFLWTGQAGEAGMQEKTRLLRLFVERCKERGIMLLDDAAFVSPLQEAMQNVADLCVPLWRYRQEINAGILCLSPGLSSEARARALDLAYQDF